MNISCIFPLKKLNEPYLSAVREYEKRLSRYCKCRFMPSKAHKQQRVNTVLFYVTSAAADAKTLSSEEFADLINGLALEGRTDVQFILSEYPPLTERVLSLSHANLSVPMMTVLLSEQIYRSFRIIHNHSYHK